MMRAFLLLVAVAAMFSGVHGGSESMSCSMVNGQMVCEKQRSDGNVAMSSSQAFSGPGKQYQNAFAGTGNTATGESSSSQTEVGQPPATFSYDSFPAQGGAGSQGANGAFAGAGAGGFPGFFPGFFGPGFGYPPSGPNNAPPQSGSVQPAAQPQPQPQPQPGYQYPSYPTPGGFDPFAFVGGFMGNRGIGFPMFPGGGAFAGAGPGAFAGAGAFAGRR